jgi:hypothetical protein
MRLLTSAILTCALLAAPPALPAAHAQAATVSQADMARLQDGVYDVSGEVSRLRAKDPQLADRLQSDLDDLRDEVIYLRVKLRKEGSVPRAEYTEMRDRLDDVRSRARDASRSPSPGVGTGSGGGGTGGRSPSWAGTEPASGPSDASRTGASGRRPDDGAIPVGQELDVRLQDSLNSGRSQVEDRFVATTLVDLQVGQRVVIPAGSELRGVVSSVTSAGRVNRKGSLTVSFDEMTVNGRRYPIRGTVTEAIESAGMRGEAVKIGASAGVGAIIGGILGGYKGALAGILIGGGGVIAATEGTEVDLPPGTVLRVRLDSPPDVR